MNIKLVYLLFVVVSVMFRCSTQSPLAGGGSDLPNGVVASVYGVVYEADSLPSVAATLELRQVIISGKSDNIQVAKTVSSDNNGQFSFNNVPPGAYQLFSRSSSGEFVALDQNLVLAAESISIKNDLYLSRPVTLVGHVLPTNLRSTSSLAVFVPGVGTSALVKKDRSYTLAGVPRGAVLLAIADDTVVNYTRLKINQTASADAYLRDIHFVVDSSYAGDKASFFRTTLKQSFYVAPRNYSKDIEPHYYKDQDFKNVSYFNYSNVNGYREWIESDSLSQRNKFDAVFYGQVYRDSLSQVVMQRWGNGNSPLLYLIGELTNVVTTQKQCAVVAVKIEEPFSMQKPIFRVVDLQIRTLDSDNGAKQQIECR